MQIEIVKQMILLIASNLFVACFIACLAYIVGRSGRRATAAHLLWLAVFVKLVTPPIVAVPFSVSDRWLEPINQVSQAFPHPQISLTSAFVASIESPVSFSDTHSVATSSQRGGDFRAVLSSLTVSRVLIMVWVAGAGLLIGRGILRYVRFSRILQSESSVDHEATSIVRQLLRTGSGERQPPFLKEPSEFVPEVRLISARLSPMLFGIGRRTCIICPDRLWQTLNNAQQRAFLAHETAHFVRRDHWVRWLEWLVTATYWWFPLIYIARRELERHEEAACDAWAISKLASAPKVYAEALLNVVDYLSEEKVGAPRLASRMQPTDALEERLRLIIASPTANRSAGTTRGLAAFCLVLLVVHPSPYVGVQAASVAFVQPGSDSGVDARPHRNNIDLGPLDPSSNSRDKGQASLPPAPRGWWNEVPKQTWADVRLSDYDLRIVAEVERGLSIQQADGTTHSFDPEVIRAIAYIPSTGRLILGNKEGELHLWDVKSSQAVSLIGKHPSAITSLAFHPQGGLVSGDQDGNLIAWDIQSGQMMASATAPGPVCAVRWSCQGDQLAVIASDWTALSQVTELRVLNSRFFDTERSMRFPVTMALVLQDRLHGWLVVDWSGNAWAIDSGNRVAKIRKEAVSGMVLCQDLFETHLQLSE